jgi:hypothetical protein
MTARMSVFNGFVEVDTSSLLLSGEFGEPALDPIGPRRWCWREVNMIVRPPANQVLITAVLCVA